MNPPSDSLSWLRQSRFGLSFHWGVASVPGRGDGWLRSQERLSLAGYEPFFAGFQPGADWAGAWARTAKEAGAGYAVLTTKHHDGFCLWPSALTDYNINRTPAAGRDLVREFVGATRREGLRVGLYYSLVDWRHPDYPHFGDRQHPMRFDEAARRDEGGRDFSRYIEFMHGQIRELLTGYGKIDLLVLDFSYWQMSGETWRAADLMRMIRALQPDMLVNDRLELDAIKRSDPPAWAGDFDTAEMNIPRARVRTEDGRPVFFDAWFSLGNNWFYAHENAALAEQRKSPKTLIRALVNCASKGGNLLLNLAPDATGRLHPDDVAALRGMGCWLRQNGESVYGAEPDARPKPEWGRWTRKGNTLYAHIMEPAIGHFSLPGLRGQVREARTLATGRPGVLGNYWNTGVQKFDQPEDLFFNFEAPIGQTYPLPDDIDTVVALELAESDAERASLLKKLDQEILSVITRQPNP